MSAYIKYLNAGGVSVITNNGNAPIVERSQGYKVSPFGQHERHSFTCKHCCRVTFVEAGCDPAELGGRCTCCDALICKYCVGYPCDHIEKKLERSERYNELIRVGGLRAPNS